MDLAVTGKKKKVFNERVDEEPSSSRIHRRMDGGRKAAESFSVNEEDSQTWGRLDLEVADILLQSRATIAPKHFTLTLPIQHL